MFDPVDPKQSFPALEHGILQYWREEDTFKRSVKHRSYAKGKAWEESHDDAGLFSFYDGPPFATGLPHYGHLLAGTIKDVIPRYQTMKGKRIERRFGWDCHGLPIENLVEKENDIKDRKEIEEKGIAWFNDLCRSSVQRYTKEWRKTVERMGRWVDMDWDYRTMDPEYMESMWWAFKKLYEKGLIYEGLKPMHICTRCATPLSNFEVTLGYRDREDQSVIMTFPLTEDPKTILLAWTTTPWSLPGNFWLAIGAHITYAKVKEGGLTYILAKNRVEEVFKGREYEIVEEIDPKDLVGLRYEPLFPYFVDTVMPSSGKKETYGDRVFKVVMSDKVEVSDEEGTGVVHVTSCLGEDSYNLAVEEGVAVLHHVLLDGSFLPEVTDFASLKAKPEGNDPMATDKAIIANLKERGRHFDSFTLSHSYPHCWRCDTPLLPYTTSSWFVAVEKIKEDLLKANSETHWVPAHIRDGRFGKWLADARDWAISRNRYWGTPLPIWRGDDGQIEVIGSREELMQKRPERFTKVTAVRHAESEGNLIPIYQGQTPGTDLTDKGKKEAKAAGAFIKERSALPVARIYSSPLSRAKQTAELIAKETGAEVVIDDRLREVTFGDWEGKNVDFSDLTFVKERRAHKIESGKAESIYHFDGMETWESVQERIRSFFSEILPEHKGEHVVVVSHADPVVNMKHFFTLEDPVKLSHQPYPEKARPYTYFWDHERNAQMDLHRETVDAISWDAAGTFARIPEVLDCWFESGSMPYAQPHFPFENTHTEDVPPGFPADFIAENLDQTRGWFYTLLVLSTALFEKPAFQHCICGGMILAEDGKKMSKSLKNYPDPNELMEKYGADSLRFALMSSPVVRAEELRFSEKPVEEILRRVVLPLWNAYSFFVLYANEAEWKSLGGEPESTHPLDKWILAEVQDLVNRMTEELDGYDLSATCGELYETLDALTNWYVRRSRRRFAGKEGDAERSQALATLHHVLITFSKAMAPFCPFVTEAIYLNLVSEDHGSIHLTDWPETRSLSADEKALMEKARSLRVIVSLGMKLRAEANVKVRQPLSVAEIALPAGIILSDADQTIMREELNVKELTLLEDPSSIAEAFVQVNARALGPRLGGRVQEIIKAAKAGDFTENDDGTLTVLGETLSPEEAQVAYTGKEGHAVASEKGIVVSLDTSLSDDLKTEGLARDVIRSVQSLRKEKGLKVSDKITLEAGKGLEGILSAHQKMIEEETQGAFGKGEGSLHVQVEVKGEKVVVSV